MGETATNLMPCNNGAIRQTARMLGQLYDDVLAPSGLRATQHTLLYTIQVMDAPTLGEMAQAMVMDLSALGRSLKPLEREGLVAIVPDPADGRAKRATLTKAGVKKLKYTAELWRNAQDRFEKAFGAKRAEELRSVLISLSSSEFREAFEHFSALKK
ncbi:MAG: MarR family transcriptional regulator [Methylovirgula sp.]|uniref:MarR family winged helix-turn-helix transcriptional regulator n=1 Tax=Methylovirgula sp. TaxID=1978224 RepID=UPI00307655B3